jgi:hypothetical protein
MRLYRLIASRGVVFGLFLSFRSVLMSRWRIPVWWISCIRHFLEGQRRLAFLSHIFPFRTVGISAASCNLDLACTGAILGGVARLAERDMAGHLFWSTIRYDGMFFYSVSLMALFMTVISRDTWLAACNT